MNASLKTEFPLVIGIDVGTTYTKALAIDDRGNFIGLASKPTSWTAVTKGNVEANAEELVAGVIDVIREVIHSATASLGMRVRVHGIGITGFAESGVIIDTGGKTLTPVVAWFDNRGEEELALLGPQFAKDFERHTGLVCNVQSTFSTLLWFKSQGISFGNGVMWLNALEYVAHRIGARRITEPSLASRTGLLDQGTGELWRPALTALGIEANFVPPMIQAGMRAGEVAVAWMPEETQGAVITVVGHDHSVGAVGAGAIGDDQLFNSAGTADVLLRTVPGVLTYDQRSALTAVGVAAGRHVLAGRTALVGGARGGLVLRRALDLIGARSGARLEEIDAAWKLGMANADLVDMTQDKAIANDIHIVIKGEATPVDLWAAALAYSSHENKKLLSGINSVVGIHKDAIGSGGWLRLRSVRESKATVIPNMHITDVKEPGAFGAALFASWAAIGEHDALIDHIKQRLRNKAEIEKEYAER